MRKKTCGILCSESHYKFYYIIFYNFSSVFISQNFRIFSEKFFCNCLFRKIFAFFGKFSHSFFQNNFAFYVNQIKTRNIAFFRLRKRTKCEIFAKRFILFTGNPTLYIYRCIPTKHACIQYIHSMQFPIQVLLLLPSQLGLINCIKIKVKYATTWPWNTKKETQR